MANSIQIFLNQPYPYYYKGKGLLIFASAIFIMAWSFNYFFEPFNVFRPEHKMPFALICFVKAFNAAIWAFLIPGITGLVTNELRWTIKKEIILLFFLLLIIGIGQFFGRGIIYENAANISVSYLLEEIRNTFLVGGLFFMLFIPVNFRHRLHQHSASARLLAFSNEPMEKNITESLPISTHQKNDDFLLNPQDFIMTRACKNYLEIFTEKEGEINKLVKRLTIKEFENQTSEIPFIFKTHRSYLVNIHRIATIKGNAQGFILIMKDQVENVPVSRSIIPEFRKKYLNR